MALLTDNDLPTAEHKLFYTNRKGAAEKDWAV